MSSMDTLLPTLLIGASGNRGQLYLKEVERSEDLKLTGVVQGKRRVTFSENVQEAPALYASLKEALEGKKYAVAILSLPHAFHHQVTCQLMDAGVPLILKEKPLAYTFEETKVYEEKLKKTGSSIVTTTQRAVMPTFVKGREELKLLGKLLSFTYTYHFSMKEITSSWRGAKNLALGGVLLDMGSHAMHYLDQLFGAPDEAEGVFSYLYKEMEEEGLEDRANLLLQYGDLKGTLSLNRHGEEKKEKLVVWGEKGKLVVTPHEVLRYNEKGELIEHFAQTLTKADVIHRLFEQALKGGERWREEEMARNQRTVACIEHIYQTYEVEKW